MDNADTIKIETHHRFLDEAGDTTFFGKGRKVILGDNGVSLAFSIGMVKINRDLSDARKEVVALQKQIESDDYLNVLPSIRKKIDDGGFFFHATDDTPEVRERFFKYIRNLDCSMEMIVARKEPERFIKKHNSQESEFYADVLSHLIKNKLKLGNKLVLNISHRANSTSNKNLQAALIKAFSRAEKKYNPDDLITRVSFNVQKHRTDPLLNVADYMCWSVQRVFEKGDTRYYDFLKERISLVVDLYDTENYAQNKNYYRRNNPLTCRNKISPPSP